MNTNENGIATTVTITRAMVCNIAKIIMKIIAKTNKMSATRSITGVRITMLSNANIPPIKLANTAKIKPRIMKGNIVMPPVKYDKF